MPILMIAYAAKIVNQERTDAALTDKMNVKRVQTKGYGIFRKSKKITYPKSPKIPLCEEKSNEATADAMSGQKEIVKTICEGGADSVIGLKGNHPNLLKKIVHALAGK